MSITEIDKKLKNNKYFYLKRINQVEKEKLWNLGEKIIFEPFQTRIYTHIIYLVMLLKVDYDNYGISGIEKFFDKKLKDKISLMFSQTRWHQHSASNKQELTKH